MRAPKTSPGVLVGVQGALRGPYRNNCPGARVPERYSLPQCFTPPMLRRFRTDLQCESARHFTRRCLAAGTAAELWA